MSSLHFDKLGNGKPLLFIHGYCDGALVWEDVCHKLSDHYTTFAIDLPGHGNSQMFDFHDSFSELATIIHTQLSQQTTEPFTIIGYSMGGYVALELARQFPRWVKAIILVHSHPFGDSALRHQSRQKELLLLEKGKSGLIKSMQLQSRFLNAEIIDPKKIKILEKLIEQALPEAIISMQKAMLTRPDHSNGITKSNIPLYFCLSPFDTHVNIEQIENLMAQEADRRLYQFTRSNHMCFWEEPILFTKVLSNILSLLK